jgi:predicted house-cleaning NTP pyrophosphatase (Maf/HAM1 superfamily)
VSFRKVTDEFIRNYIDNYRPLDKAGSYGAQECLEPGKNYLSREEKHFLKEIGRENLFEESLAVSPGIHVPLIDSIHGSYFNVMGLPLEMLYSHLKQNGAL